MGLRGKTMRLRFATVEFFPKRYPGEENERGTKLVRITPTTGGAGRELFSKLLGRAGVPADTSTDRAEPAADRDPQRRPTDARVEGPPDR